MDTLAPRKLDFVFVGNGDAKTLDSCLVGIGVLAECCEMGVDIPLGKVFLFGFFLVWTSRGHYCEFRCARIWMGVMLR
jgi:hypothetical protein